MCQHILVRLPKFHGNPSSSSRIVTCVQKKEGRSYFDRRFSGFQESGTQQEVSVAVIYNVNMNLNGCSHRLERNFRWS
jgi:hypothetical protein